MNRPGWALLALVSTTSATAQDAPAPEPAAEAAEAPDATGATTYRLIPSASTLAVLVRYDRKALVAGHDHVIVASDFDGEVTWDPANPSACAISISFPVSALEVDPMGARDRFGLKGDTPDSDKKKIQNNYEGPTQLDASNFPTISFRSKSCRENGDRFDVTGPLTIHGVGHDVTASMAIDTSSGKFKASGTFSAQHQDFGFDPFTALFGSLRNDDLLKFSVNVTGTPR